jgi:hypothetical protein
VSPANIRAISLPALAWLSTLLPSAATDHEPPDFDQPAVSPSSKSSLSDGPAANAVAAVMPTAAASATAKPPAITARRRPGPVALACFIRSS